MEFFKARLEQGGPETEGWYGWYAIRQDGERAGRTLIGSGGYLGPPDDEGTVEIGFSVLPEWRRCGYASEIVSALIVNAFSHAQVQRIMAHTAVDNRASIGVLVRNQFRNATSVTQSSLLEFIRRRAEVG